MANAQVERLRLAQEPWALTYPAAATDAYQLAWECRGPERSLESCAARR